MKKNIIHIKKYLISYLFLLVFLLGCGAIKAQTDYSGIYYIASTGYNSANPTTNYYLCPTEEWCYYQATDDFTSQPNETPFLTTHKCRDGVYDVNAKAVWYVEKHPTEDYYYIRRVSDGKYIVLNGQINTTGDANRMRVHLEALAEPDDKALFALLPDPDGTALNIKPKTLSTYLTVNGGNDNNLVGVSGKTGGPTGYVNTKGIIGIYATRDNNSKFYLENAAIHSPVITNNHDGTFTITAEAGATIYYTTDGTTPTLSTPNTGSTPVIISQTESMAVIKAMAHIAGDPFPSDVTTYDLPVCERPDIVVNNGDVSISCATLGSTIHYTTDGSEPTNSSPTYSGSFNLGSSTIVRAIATKAGYRKSNEAVYLPPLTVHSSSEMVDMSRRYFLASDFISTASIGTSDNPFTGVIDGQLNTVSGLDHPLVAYADGATIKNVFVDNVNISGGTNVGAICNEAVGSTRIYNCGVLASNSTVAKDADGYDVITLCSSTISGSGYVGGIVGLLDGTSRVINCFSYANVAGGSYVGGIVGYNNVATTANSLNTMVMNCMFYGEVSGASIAPIYNGEIITNDGDANGVNNFNYFRIEASYIQDNNIAKVYNCALGAETRFLQRFEFYRHLLNSNRELAVWWATGDAANKDEMMKWVMEPSQIGTTTPYPVLKTPGRYASVVNYTPNLTAYDVAHRCQGRKLTGEGDNGVLHVTIQMGTGGAQFTAPTGAGLKPGESGVLDLIITDKDFEHFNFNYGKVQLPYYNDYCDGNYTGNRVVTGWKITSITGGTAGSFTTGDDAPAYNFADRKCTDKDLYSASGRVFNQGAYWDVPEGVTAITIQPYWGKAVYLSDAYWDVTYKNGTGNDFTKAGYINDAMTTPINVTTVGGSQRYNNGVSTFNGQIVFTSMSDAISSSKDNGLFKGATESASHTVYDYAVVLVGNYHHTSTPEASEGKPYTVTSVDLDGDNEPDYSLILRFNARPGFHPVRYDFLNLIGLGMAQKTTGGTGSYNLGIMQPKYWFEVTNTALFRVTQFEYSGNDRVKKPYILQGGVIEQWVTQQQDAGDRVSYFHVGGNVWFKEFHRGSHQDHTNKSTPHPPISVTGGDFDKFYLTGFYQSQAKIYDDNAECYINGGRFGEMAGAGMEGIGTSVGKGNITWIIDNADIDEFYGGGINFDKPVFGNINTIISNSNVRQYCGGPKFGDMKNGRTVTTTATNCVFGTYFGAGYGGNSYSRYAPANRNNVINLPGEGTPPGNSNVTYFNSWNDWVQEEYTQSYSGTYGGISTQIDYQFIPMSSNISNVARLWVEFVGFSLATTHNVTSVLKGCTILNDFYGGGSLGKVDGPVTSTLDSCIVYGSVYGAGYSASLPTVEVDQIGFQSEPYYYESLGTYRTGVKGPTTTYRWEHAGSISIDNANHILYTTVDLDGLGKVIGDVEVRIYGKTRVFGSVYGGGNQGEVEGNTKVIINQEHQE